jgi:hypothetical protein
MIVQFVPELLEEVRRRQEEPGRQVAGEVVLTHTPAFRKQKASSS